MKTSWLGNEGIYTSGDVWGTPELLEHANNTGGTLHSSVFEVYVRRSSIKKIVKLFISNGFHLSKDTDYGNRRIKFFTKDFAVVTMEYRGNALEMGIAGVSAELVQTLTKAVKAFSWQPRRPYVKPKTQLHFMALDGMGRLNLQPVGHVDAPLERDNYPAPLLAQYDRAVKDLTSSKPRGSVIIMDGPTGTGKTYMVRGLITTLLENALVALYPPDQIDKIMDPAIVTTLLQWASPDRPLVLVLEDADQVLSERAAASMAGIAAALNLGDGLLGDVLNVRIIATTNTPLKEIDPALLRPGRLSERMEVGNLNKSDATRVFKRIVTAGTKTSLAAAYGEENDCSMPPTISLATVYSLANGVNRQNEVVHGE